MEAVAPGGAVTTNEPSVPNSAFGAAVLVVLEGDRAFVYPFAVPGGQAAAQATVGRRTASTGREAVGDGHPGACRRIPRPPFSGAEADRWTFLVAASGTDAAAGPVTPATFDQLVTSLSPGITTKSTGHPSGQVCRGQ